MRFLVLLKFCFLSIIAFADSDNSPKVGEVYQINCEPRGKYDDIRGIRLNFPESRLNGRLIIKEQTKKSEYVFEINFQLSTKQSENASLESIVIGDQKAQNESSAEQAVRGTISVIPKGISNFSFDVKNRKQNLISAELKEKLSYLERINFSGDSGVYTATINEWSSVRNPLRNVLMSCELTKVNNL